MSIATRLRSGFAFLINGGHAAAASYGLGACRGETFWVPSSGGPVTAPAELMDDDGCAGPAHGVDFEDPDAPGAILTCWLYPVPCAPGEDGFELGRRWEYLVYREMQEPWTATDYDTYHPGDVWFASLEDATEGARTIAGTLASSSYAGDPCRSLSGFDWDGATWGETAGVTS